MEYRWADVIGTQYGKGRIACYGWNGNGRASIEDACKKLTQGDESKWNDLGHQNHSSKDVTLKVVAMLLFVLAVMALPLVACASDAEDPCTVEMRVGEAFDYSPETNLPSVFAVHGSAMAEEGGFLLYDEASNILYGTAVKPGQYTAVIEALWICPDSPNLTQTAYQHITFDVSASAIQEDRHPETETSIVNHAVAGASAALTAIGAIALCFSRI